jgi:hypothetical protein
MIAFSFVLLTMVCGVDFRLDMTDELRQFLVAHTGKQHAPDRGAKSGKAISDFEAGEKDAGRTCARDEDRIRAIQDRGGTDLLNVCRDTVHHWLQHGRDLIGRQIGRR